MPLFFDLNLPYSAGAGANRDCRLRAVVSLLELGYSGAAYNLSLRGVLSDKDRCAIAPFPLTSLLAAAPSLAASASFHCGLLGSGAGEGPAFRQFSRVTVSVDTAAAAGSVGSTGAVLRGYDVVAVRPVSQSAFEHVCKFSQVDLISIDFSQKVPFRLRHQSVELAVQRGIYFEITYSHLLSDNTNIKRQMLSDAKMLADWTRGKNLIVSSGASNANEIRGPNDVSNLISFLLGLSKERAKAAISDNCRSLLAKALRKKHFYKETIRIDSMPTNQSELNPFSVGDWIKWDPLSSGKGDLPSLEEISKVSSSVSLNPSDPKKIKAIDCDSIVQEKLFLLSQHADKLHKIKPVSGNREETKADEMQLDDQEALLNDCDLKNDDITLVSGCSNQFEGIVHKKIEAPLKEYSFEKENYATVSDGYGEELSIPSIESELEKDHNAPEAVSDGTMAITSINNEVTMEETSLLNNSMDEQYTDTKKIDQKKDEKEGDGKNINNRDVIVETKEVEGDILKINLINDEDKKGEKIVEDIDVEEEQGREFKIIKLGDNKETVDATTSSSSSISLMEKVLHDLGGEISNFTRGPSCTSSTKGKRKQKGLPLHPSYTMSFKGPLKHMLFKKKSKR